MWILELIIVIILIANDFSFWQIMLIMIVFMPLFYLLIFPLIISLFSENLFKKKENKQKELEKEINDFQNDLDIEYKKLQLKENKNKSDEIIELEKLDEEWKDIYLDYIYELLEKKDYKKIIDFHNKKYLSDYLIETNNIKELSEYYLLIGASYQETWNLKLAGKCFDIFLDNILPDSNTIKSFKKQGVDDIWVIKMMILVKELQNIGLDYKMENEVYEKFSKIDDKNKNRKSKK